MVNIGSACGKQVVALITDMDQPLGEYAGNALEVVECIEVMKGRGAKDLVSLSEELSAHCLVVGGAAADTKQGAIMFRAAIASGRALERFRDVIGLQGGDPRVTEDYSLLPQARHSVELPAPSAGFVQSMDTQKIGLALCILGAGRETVDSEIDPGVGIRFHKKIGDRIDAGDSLCTIYYNDNRRYREARDQLAESYGYSARPVERPLLVKKTISFEA
jgi:thymidine phosphorylase